MKFDTCSAAFHAAARPGLLRPGNFVSDRGRAFFTFKLVAGACCVGLLVLGGCGRQQSAPPATDDSALYDARRTGPSLVIPFQEPIFNVEAEGQRGKRVENAIAASDAELSSDPELRPIPAAQLVGPLGSQNIAGSLVDREMASIPVPNRFNDIKPSATNDLLQQGADLLRGGKLDDALAVFYQAVNVEPTSALGYEFLGQCYLAKNEPAKAVANLDSAIRLNPKAVNAYVVRANANFKLKFARRAMDDLNQALALDPKNVGALTWRAITQINEGHSREARDDCNAVLKLDPRVLDAFVVRCLANLQLGDPNGARADYQSTVALGLNDETLKMMRGWFELFGQPLSPASR